MMKKIFAAILIVMLLFSGCQRILPDEPIPDEPRKLLEFPGLQWNSRPSEVKKALSLQDGDLLKIAEDETEGAPPTDYRLISVKGEALGELFGGKVKYAHFHCYDNHTGENKGNYGLGLIRIYYEDDVDMEVVRQAVAEQYGAESPSTYFMWQMYPGGGEETVIFDLEEFEQKKDTQVLTPYVSESTEHSFYWGSEKKVADFVTGEI